MAPTCQWFKPQPAFAAERTRAKPPWPSNTQPWRGAQTQRPRNEHLRGAALASPSPSAAPQQQPPPTSPRVRATTAATTNPAMDLFPDGSFVRLRNRANGKYLDADEDWAGVSLRDSRRGRGGLSAACLPQVWRVQHLQLEPGGPVFLLLQGAAYGRYLAVTPESDPVPGQGLAGLRAVQRDLDDRSAVVFRWTPSREGPHQSYVRIRHVVDNLSRDLRTTGSRYSPWSTGVTVDVHLDYGFSWTSSTTMMHWTVMPVASSSEPLPLPVAHAPPPQSPNQEEERPVCLPLRRLAFWQRGVHPNQSSWTIRHVRANPDGVFNQNHDAWPSNVFNDRSVFNLRTQMAYRELGYNGDVNFITLCVRPGVDGRLMPLVTDLPRTTEPIDIVVLTTGSPAAAALVYPHFDPLAL